MQRDPIGYGACPPNSNWPNQARLAVNFVLNFKEGSEPSIPDGDAASEWALTGYGGASPRVAGRDLAAEGMFANDSRVGFWRILRLFQKRGLATGADYFHDAFDFLYAEAIRPRMMSIGLQIRLIGHPASAAGLQRLLGHIGRFDGVWVTRRLEIATQWATHVPAPRAEPGRGTRITQRC